MTHLDDIRAQLKEYFMRTFGVTEWQAEAHTDGFIRKFPHIAKPEDKPHD